MAELFDKDVLTISEHIGNVYSEAELETTIRKFRIVRQNKKILMIRLTEHFILLKEKAHKEPL